MLNAVNVKKLLARVNNIKKEFFCLVICLVPDNHNYQLSDVLPYLNEELQKNNLKFEQKNILLNSSPIVYSKFYCIYIYANKNKFLSEISYRIKVSNKLNSIKKFSIIEFE